ncbi:hypothetical protein CLAIMM_15140 [Cladophialophora immunda]|nr:hypothetical protein CLAIMM_15140 [Cladophialophora immunda]
MPSGGSHPRKAKDIRTTVSTQLALGMRPIDVSRVNNVSPSFVTQQRHRDEAESLGLEAGGVVRGRPRAIHAAAMEAINLFIEDFPTARRDEICDLLKEEYDIDVHATTAGRILKELDLTRKRITKINIRRDETLVAAFLAEMTRFTPDHLVSLDESAANERTGDRKYSWSPRGVPCRVRASNRRSTRWSILPALTIDGWLDYEIYHGSFDGDRFLAFMERLLQQMNAFPGPRSVLLLDNASIHHGERIQTLAAQHGVILTYLPPYSPHLNPIEMAFHELKEWLRKNRDLGYIYEHEFETFLHLGMEAVCPARTARKYFRSCGYGLSTRTSQEDHEEREE